MVDIPANFSTTATFDGDPLVIATFNGELETPNDADFIRLDLIAGRFYTICASTSTVGPSGGDSYLQLISPQGQLLSAVNGSATSLNSLYIAYSPSQTGTFYLSILDVEGAIGQYSIGIAAVETFESIRDSDGNNFADLNGTNFRKIGGKGDDVYINAQRAFGEQGSDQLYGTIATDLLSGGLGDDVIAGYGGDDQLFGDFGNDLLIGGDGSDIMRGDAGDDTIYGEDGNDIIRAGDGADKLFGGRGNDVLYVDASDQIDGGNDYDFATAYFSTTGVSIVTSAISVEGAYGSQYGDYIDAGSQTTGGAFYGYFGDDQIVGTPFADYIHGGGGNDLLYVDGTDTIEGDIGRDFVTAYYSHTPLTIDTGFANVEGVYGSRFNDYINAGSQTVSGEFFGYDGNDVIIGTAFNDSINGGAGNDVVVYAGSFSEYSLLHQGDILYVGQLSTGIVDQLTAVETLRFLNGDVALS